MADLDINEGRFERRLLDAGGAAQGSLAERILRMGIATAPRHSGRLAASHTIVRGRQGRPYVVRNVAPYAAAVLYGRHPGVGDMRAQPWLTRAARQVASRPGGNRA